MKQLYLLLDHRQLLLQYAGIRVIRCDRLALQLLLYHEELPLKQRLLLLDTLTRLCSRRSLGWLLRG